MTIFEKILENLSFGVAPNMRINYIGNIIHNENEPAIIRADGTEEWYINNKLHREDGPAVLWNTGAKQWYYKGLNITDEVEEWLYERNINPKNMTEEDKLALSFFMRSLV